MQEDKKTEMKRIIEDTRKCHFVLGQEPTLYESNAQSTQRNLGNGVFLLHDVKKYFLFLYFVWKLNFHIGKLTSESVQASIDACKLLKQQLQRTNFTVGCDPDYM